MTDTRMATTALDNHEQIGGERSNAVHLFEETEKTSNKDARLVIKPLEEGNGFKVNERTFTLQSNGDYVVTSGDKSVVVRGLAVKDGNISYNLTTETGNTLSVRENSDGTRTVKQQNANEKADASLIRQPGNSDRVVAGTGGKGDSNPWTSETYDNARRIVGIKHQHRGDFIEALKGNHGLDPVAYDAFKKYFSANNDQDRREAVAGLKKAAENNISLRQSSRELQLVDALLKLESNKISDHKDAIASLKSLSGEESRGLKLPTRDREQLQQRKEIARSGNPSEVLIDRITWLSDQILRRNGGLVKDLEDKSAAEANGAAASLDRFFRPSDADRSSALRDLQDLGQNTTDETTRRDVSKIVERLQLVRLNDQQDFTEQFTQLIKSGNQLALDLLKKAGIKVENLAEALKDAKALDKLTTLLRTENKQATDEFKVMLSVRNLDARSSVHDLDRALVSLDKLRRDGNAVAQDWYQWAEANQKVRLLTDAAKTGGFPAAKQELDELVKLSKKNVYAQEALTSILLADVKSRDAQVVLSTALPTDKPSLTINLDGLNAEQKSRLQLQVAGGIADRISAQGFRNEQEARTLVLAYGALKETENIAVARSIGAAISRLSAADEKLPDDQRRVAMDAAITVLRANSRGSEAVADLYIDLMRDNKKPVDKHLSELLATAYSGTENSKHAIKLINTIISGYGLEYTKNTSGNRHVAEQLADSFYDRAKKDVEFRKVLIDSLIEAATKHGDKGIALATLGRVAALDEKLDPKVAAALRKGVLSDDPATHKSAVSGMMEVKDYWQTAEIRSLTFEITEEIRQQIEKHAGSLPVNIAKEMLTELRTFPREKDASVLRRIDAMVSLSEHASIKDIEAITRVAKESIPPFSVTSLRDKETYLSSQLRDREREQEEARKRNASDEELATLSKSVSEALTKLNGVRDLLKTAVVLEERQGKTIDALLTIAANSEDADARAVAFQTFLQTKWTLPMNSKEIRGSVAELVRRRPDDLEMNVIAGRLIGVSSMSTAAMFKYLGAPNDNAHLIELTKQAVDKHGAAKVRSVAASIAFLNNIPGGERVEPSRVLAAMADGTIEYTKYASLLNVSSVEKQLHTQKDAADAAYDKAKENLTRLMKLGAESQEKLLKMTAKGVGFWGWLGSAATEAGNLIRIDGGATTPADDFKVQQSMGLREIKERDKEINAAMEGLRKADEARRAINVQFDLLRYYQTKFVLPQERLDSETLSLYGAHRDTLKTLAPEVWQEFHGNNLMGNGWSRMYRDGLLQFHRMPELPEGGSYDSSVSLLKLMYKVTKVDAPIVRKYALDTLDRSQFMRTAYTVPGELVSEIQHLQSMAEVADAGTKFEPFIDELKRRVDGIKKLFEQLDSKEVRQLAGRLRKDAESVNDLEAKQALLDRAQQIENLLKVADKHRNPFILKADNILNKMEPNSLKKWLKEELPVAAAELLATAAAIYFTAGTAGLAIEVAKGALVATAAGKASAVVSKELLYGLGIRQEGSELGDLIWERKQVVDKETGELRNVSLEKDGGKFALATLEEFLRDSLINMAAMAGGMALGNVILKAKGLVQGALGRTASTAEQAVVSRAVQLNEAVGRNEALKSSSSKLLQAMGTTTKGIAHTAKPLVGFSVVGAGVSDAIDRTFHDDLDDARKRLGIVADLAKGLAESVALMALHRGYAVKTFPAERGRPARVQATFELKPAEFNDLLNHMKANNYKVEKSWSGKITVTSPEGMSLEMVNKGAPLESSSHQPSSQYIETLVGYIKQYPPGDHLFKHNGTSTLRVVHTEVAVSHESLLQGSTKSSSVLESVNAAANAKSVHGGSIVVLEVPKVVIELPSGAKVNIADLSKPTNDRNFTAADNKFLQQFEGSPQHKSLLKTGESIYKSQAEYTSRCFQDHAYYQMNFADFAYHDQSLMSAFKGRYTNERVAKLARGVNELIESWQTDYQGLRTTKIESFLAAEAKFNSELEQTKKTKNISQEQAMKEASDPASQSELSKAFREHESAKKQMPEADYKAYKAALEARSNSMNALMNRLNRTQDLPKVKVDFVNPYELGTAAAQYEAGTGKLCLNSRNADSNISKKEYSHHAIHEYVHFEQDVLMIRQLAKDLNIGSTPSPAELQKLQELYKKATGYSLDSDFGKQVVSHPFERPLTAEDTARARELTSSYLEWNTNVAPRRIELLKRSTELNTLAEKMDPKSGVPIEALFKPTPENFASLPKSAVKDKVVQFVKDPKSFSAEQIAELRLELSNAYREHAGKLMAERRDIYRNLQLEIEAWNVGRRVSEQTGHAKTERFNPKDDSANWRTQKVEPPKEQRLPEATRTPAKLHPPEPNSSDPKDRDHRTPRQAPAKIQTW